MEEHFGAVEHAKEYVAECGDAVGRHFEQQHGCFAAEEGSLEDPSECERHEDPEGVHGEDDRTFFPCRGFGQEEGDHEGVDGEPSGAAHEGGDEDGDEAVFPIFDGASGHDAWDGAGEGAHEGDERFPVKTDFGHDAVHQEGGAGHVAAVFEEAEEEGQDEDLGEEDDDAANAGEDSVDEEGAEVGIWEGLGEEVGEGFLRGFDEVHRPLGDGEDAEEHGGHGREEDGPSPEAVGEDGVELV